MLPFAPVLVRNELPTPPLRFCIVPPFKVSTDAAGGVKDTATATLNVAPLLIVRPEVVSVLTDVPACCTVPSSTRMELAVWADVVVTTKAPVASAPAEKTAESDAAQVVVAEPPVESVVQLLVAVSQFPVGVAPAPAVAPFKSQYFVVAPNADEIGIVISGIAANAAN